MNDIKILLEKQTFTIENSMIRREYFWNNGHLISRELTDKTSTFTWNFSAAQPDFSIPGMPIAADDSKLTIKNIAATPVTPAHVIAEIITSFGPLSIKRIFRVYSETPAIACDFFIKGEFPRDWAELALEAAPQIQNENVLTQSTQKRQPGIIEQLDTNQLHLNLKCIQFFDITDRQNNLISAKSVMPYLQPIYLTGNLLFIENHFENVGIFMLKEAPCSDVQLTWPGFDFYNRCGLIQMAGPGIHPDDLAGREWTRAYGFVTGVAKGNELSLLTALRQYQNNIRRRDYDNMLLLNTWGDRSQDTRLSEAFTKDEITAAARLGLTHFQLDDGWQNGRSSNSAFEGGSLDNIWEMPNYCEPHTERFPNQLAPVLKTAKSANIKIGLWFNPSKDNSYENWEKDADTLIQLHKKYGILTFKIDGVEIPDKKAEMNLRRMLSKVRQATNNQVIFNLDITAGHRFGYHYFNEFGNLFLENRYTDMQSYYPHWTLRNLWTLAKYVPTQSLQIEFLNKWRNIDRYPEDDPLAPNRVPFGYCFAITMMAQPLAWFEASHLPEEAFAVAALVNTYREYQADIHDGLILPIGSEPNGTTWTGFQSLKSRTEGYVLVFREQTQIPQNSMRLWQLPHQKIQFEHLAGQGTSFGTDSDEKGGVIFELPRPFSFALYAYSV